LTRRAGCVFTSAFGVGRSALGVQRSAFSVRYSTFIFKPPSPRRREASLLAPQKKAALD